MYTHTLYTTYIHSLLMYTIYLLLYKHIDTHNTSTHIHKWPPTNIQLYINVQHTLQLHVPYRHTNTLTHIDTHIQIDKTHRHPTQSQTDIHTHIHTNNGHALNTYNIYVETVLHSLEKPLSLNFNFGQYFIVKFKVV